MVNLGAKISGFISTVFCIFLATGTAHANYVYDYTATNWEYWAGNGPGASALYYPTIQPLTFSFETATPISSVGGFTDFTSQIIAWQYSGHRAETAVTSLTPNITFSFAGWTNSANQIIAHSFSISGPLQGTLQYPGGSFSAASGGYDSILVNPGPSYRPLLGYDIRGNALFCGPPCSEGGNTFYNYGFPAWASPRVGTLGLSPSTGGGGSGGVPEPATWALMILGFGGIGTALRSRRQKVSVRYA